MKTVLVVDDDLDTRHIWQTVLEHHGYAVLGASDGPQGVSMAQTHTPDLILMNLSMPTLDGLSATMLLRQDPRTAEIPIIACTGFVREEGEDEAEHAGVDAYLEKPCEPSRMAEAVERMIGPALAPAEGQRIRH
jgi:two-component system, cell cycle response regulator DivK